MSRRRILIVEDDERSQRLFRDILDLAGFDVCQARSVEEGRSALRETRPCLVVMDIRIPGGGGELLLSEIKQDPALAGTPVIAVTASAMAGDCQRLLEVGFDGYVSKPIDARTFPSTIASFLDGGEHER